MSQPMPETAVLCSLCHLDWNFHVENATNRVRALWYELQDYDSEESFNPDESTITVLVDDCVYLLLENQRGPMGPVGYTGPQGPQGVEGARAIAIGRPGL